MHTVVVEPLPVGWRVAASPEIGDQYFLSGKSAERSVRHLAQQLATAGELTELTLRLRGGTLAARFLCLPPARPTELPVMIEPPPRSQANDSQRGRRSRDRLIRDGERPGTPSHIMHFGLIQGRT